jgi:glycosyltransferase involved in cell wall biosynthesis
MPTVSHPLVSIIIPTYNRAHMLACAIESAINQTYPNKQIIVVDDGSVDNTHALVARYSQVEYFFQQNGGQGKARNTGLHHAKGYYIASLDSDDAWNPDFLERCIEKLDNKNIGFVFANWMQVASDEESYDYLAKTGMLSTQINSSNKPWILLENTELRKIYLEACPSPSSSFVLRREDMIGNWNEQLNIADDWCLLWDMILLKRCNAAFTTDTLWIKRTDGQNICDGRNGFELMEYLLISDYRALIERHKRNLKKFEIKLLNKKIARWTYELYLYKLFKLKLTAGNNSMFKKALRSNPFLFGDVLLRFTIRNIKKIPKKIATR